MSNEIDHALDGVDRPPGHRHVSWQARQLVADFAELKSMSDEDKRRYSDDRL